MTKPIQESVHDLVKVVHAHIDLMLKEIKDSGSNVDASLGDAYVYKAVADAMKKRADTFRGALTDTLEFPAPGDPPNTLDGTKFQAITKCHTRKGSYDTDRLIDAVSAYIHRTTGRPVDRIATKQVVEAGRKDESIVRVLEVLAKSVE